MEYINTVSFAGKRLPKLANTNYIKCARIWVFSDPCTAWKVSKYGVFSGPFFPVFGLNKSPYSVRIQENTDQKKLGIWKLFSRNGILAYTEYGKTRFIGKPVYWHIVHSDRHINAFIKCSTEKLFWKLLKNLKKCWVATSQKLLSFLDVFHENSQKFPE